MKRGEFNLDIATKVAEFESLLNKVLPRRIFYKLILYGKGLEFDGYRVFSSEEDASLIDWKASARSTNLLARQYVEERNMNVVFVFDIGENMIFGSQEKLKCEYAAEMASAFSHSVLNVNDKVGFVLFNDNIERICYPLSGNKQFDVFVYNISDPYAYQGVSDIGAIIDKLLEILGPSTSMVVLVSDFLRVNESQRKQFEKLGTLYETIALMIRDPLDRTLPDINKEVIIEDYNNERLLINPSVVKKTYENMVEKQTKFVKDLFFSSQIDLLELDTSKDFAFDLAHFLAKRIGRRE